LIHLHLLAAEAVQPSFTKGMIAFLAMFVIFVGSIWLLLSMILGARLGYFVAATTMFGVIMLIAAIWFVTGLGPKGPDGFFGHLGEETGWQPIAAGPHLTSINSPFGVFDVSNTGGGGWIKPAKDKVLADLQLPDDSTLVELDTAKPVMDGLVLGAISPIPGKVKEVAEQIHGKISLESGKFQTTDVRMKQVKVDGKDSILAAGRSVPSDTMSAGDLGGAKEGKVSKYLAELDSRLSPGDPVMEVKTDSGTVVLKADKPGRLILFGFKVGDKIKPNVSFATVDITGQPGTAQPAEVAAVRVRGSVKVPAAIYFLTALILFALHLIGLSKVEKRQKLTAQPVQA